MANELKHYGVLGMRWGKHKRQEQEYDKSVRTSRTKYQSELLRLHKSGQGNNTEALISVAKAHDSEVAAAKAKLKRDIADSDFEQKVMTQRNIVRAYNAAADRMNHGGIEAFNNRPEYKNKNLYDDPELFKKYNEDYAKEFGKALTAEAEKIFGTYPSGTKKLVGVADPNGGFGFVVEEIKHESLMLNFAVERDENGFITSISLANKDQISQSEDSENSLMHWGVKGMRWGHRKAKIEGIKRVAGKVVNSKAFKTLVYDKDNVAYGIFKKSEVEKAKNTVNKIINSKAFKAMVYDKNNVTMGIFKKSEVEKGKATVKSVLKKLDTMRDNFNKSQYLSAMKTMEKLRARGDKIMEEELQAEIDDLFTKEEIARWTKK